MPTPPPQQGLSHTGRQLGKMDVPFPARTEGQGSSSHRGLRVLAGKGHETFRSQTRDSGHFFKPWKIRDFCFVLFWFVVFFFLRKKRERRKDLLCCVPLCLPVPDMARRHQPASRVAPCSGFMGYLLCLTGPQLSRPHLLNRSMGHGPSRQTSQLHLLQAWARYQGQRRVRLSTSPLAWCVTRTSMLSKCGAPTPRTHLSC